MALNARTTARSGICGKLDLMILRRSNSFHVTFPDEPNLAVASVEFDADTLRVRGTASSGTSCRLDDVDLSSQNSRSR
jgi:hypothetical protein